MRGERNIQSLYAIKLSCYQLKIGCYNYNVFYVRLMVTTKEEPVVDTQKITLKESKHTTIKSHQITNEDSKREKMNKSTTTARNQLTKWQ